MATFGLLLAAFIPPLCGLRSAVIPRAPPSSWADAPPLLAGGCDETCAAYVLVELLDDSTGNVIEGYDRASFNPIMNQSAIDIPLLWNNSSRLPQGHGHVTAGEDGVVFDHKDIPGVATVDDIGTDEAPLRQPVAEATKASDPK